ncbi:MAG: hypothetical protein ABJC07_06985 [Acidobacteriota bacterium]
MNQSPSPSLHAYRVRPAAVLDVTGEDRAAFLQGQLTQDVRCAEAGQVLRAAGLTPKGKLLFVARLLGMPDRLRLLLPAASRESVVRHLAKYAVFQKVRIEDRSADFARIGIVGPPLPSSAVVGGWLALPGEAEFSGELLVPAAELEDATARLVASGAVSLDDAAAEVLRVEAGRPRFGQDADESHLPDEVGLADAISTTKGCYVGQEIVARLRTYGRVNRRLVGFRFPDAAVPVGTVLKRPGEPDGGKVEMGRVTSSVLSPRLGPIGLGWAFRDVAPGERLVSTEAPDGSAIPSNLPFP